jgi:hypothetical protein
MRTYHGDYTYGKSIEAKCKPLLERELGIELVEQPRYSLFDLIDNNNTVYVEIKARNCSSQSFPTLYMNKDKILLAKKNKIENPSRRYYFAFHMRDGIFYTEYESDRFATYAEDIVQRWDRDCLQPPTTVVLIPVCDLIRLKPSNII